MTLVAPVPPWILEICQLVGGKNALPRSHSVAASSAKRRREQVHRVLHQVRIGDVTLHALDDQLAGKRAAPAVLDRVAELAYRGGLADDAVIEQFAARLELFHHPHRAVHRHAFFVRGEQQRDRALVLRVCGDEFLGRADEGRDGRLHVRSAAAVQPALAHAGGERIGLPLVQRAGGHHVGMSGKTQQRFGLAAARPQIADVAAAHALQGEADGGEALRDKVLAAGVIRRERAQPDQLLCEFQCG